MPQWTMHKWNRKINNCRLRFMNFLKSHFTIPPEKSVWKSVWHRICCHASNEPKSFLILKIQNILCLFILVCHNSIMNILLLWVYGMTDNSSVISHVDNGLDLIGINIAWFHDLTELFCNKTFDQSFRNLTRLQNKSWNYWK